MVLSLEEQIFCLRASMQFWGKLWCRVDHQLIQEISLNQVVYIWATCSWTLSGTSFPSTKNLSAGHGSPGHTEGRDYQFSKQCPRETFLEALVKTRRLKCTRYCTSGSAGAEGKFVCAGAFHRVQAQPDSRVRWSRELCKPCFHSQGAICSCVSHLSIIQNGIQLRDSPKHFLQGPHSTPWVPAQLPAPKSSTNRNCLPTPGTASPNQSSSFLDEIIASFHKEPRSNSWIVTWRCEECSEIRNVNKCFRKH